MDDRQVQTALDKHYDLYLRMEQHAREHAEDAQSDRDEAYWQGVKDGLRKLWTTLTNSSNAVGGLSPIERPDGARQKVGRLDQ